MFSRLLGMKRKKSASAEETERHAKVTLIDAAETDPEIDHPVVQLFRQFPNWLINDKKRKRRVLVRILVRIPKSPRFSKLC